MKNLLVTLADKNYIDQAKQLFSSVYFNAGWKGDYMLLAHEIPEKELKWFREKGILIKKCKPLHNKKIGIYPPTLLAKFYLFTPEFKKWDNIIYLDADIIVRASLNELTKIKYFGAVIDKNIFKVNLKAHFKEIDKNKKIWNKIKQNYNIKSSTFNAGVMCFNTNIIKEGAFFELITLFKKYYKICLLGDQPIFNLFFKKWEKLPEVYNVYINFKIWGDNKIKNIKGIILHFNHLEYKPWESTNHFYKEWKNNLNKSELIDLNKIDFPIKKWSRNNIYKYSLFLREKYLIAKTLNNTSRIIPKIINSIDRYIGLVGIFLKKHFLRLYLIIKYFKK